MDSETRLGTWIAVGVAIGTALFAVSGDAFWIAIGVAIGAGIGAYSGNSCGN